MFDSNEEYAAATMANPDTEARLARPTDEQDRVLIEHLTDREIAVETLTYLRLLTDLLTEATQNPIVAKMFGIPANLLSKR